MAELEQGIKVEHEHTDTYDWIMRYVMKHNDFPELDEFAQHIAEDHLKEDPEYYTKLKKAKL